MSRLICLCTVLCFFAVTELVGVARGQGGGPDAGVAPLRERDGGAAVAPGFTAGQLRPIPNTTAPVPETVPEDQNPRDQIGRGGTDQAPTLGDHIIGIHPETAPTGEGDSVACTRPQRRRSNQQVLDQLTPVTAVFVPRGRVSASVRALVESDAVAIAVDPSSKRAPQNGPCGDGELARLCATYPRSASRIARAQELLRTVMRASLTSSPLPLEGDGRQAALRAKERMHSLVEAQRVLGQLKRVIENDLTAGHPAIEASRAKASASRLIATALSGISSGFRAARSAERYFNCVDAGRLFGTAPRPQLASSMATAGPRDMVTADARHTHNFCSTVLETRFTEGATTEFMMIPTVADREQLSSLKMLAQLRRTGLQGEDRAREDENFYRECGALVVGRLRVRPGTPSRYYLPKLEGGVAAEGDNTEGDAASAAD